MSVAVLWAALTLAHQTHETLPLLFLLCSPALPGRRNQHTGAVPHTYVDDSYLEVHLRKCLVSSLQKKNLGSVNLNLNTNKSWATRECMRGLKVNTEPKVM